MKRTLCALLAVVSFTAAAHPTSAATDAGVVAFNHALAAATRAMDNQAILGLWEDGGISLLPDTPPIGGKPAIANFLAQVSKQLRGAHMRKFELACHEIQTEGDWSSEWCEEHQLVSFANGRPLFTGTGRMLLVLHREPNRAWRLSREMWQPAKR
jgi:ketosteroid isomerase-like protein